MQNIHDEQDFKLLSEDVISVIDSSFCLRLQCGLTQL